MPSSAFVAGCICSAVAGAFIALQSGANSTLGSIAGRSFASVVSFAVGLGTLVVFFLVEVYALGGKGPTHETVAHVPWWGWIGGFLGAWYVAVVIIFAPTLGAATLMSIFVSAQLSMAVLLDSMGWAGFRRRPFHWARLGGLMLMVLGVVLITHFDGSDRSSGGSSSTVSTGNGTAPASVSNNNTDAAAPTDNNTGSVSNINGTANGTGDGISAPNVRALLSRTEMTDDDCSGSGAAGRKGATLVAMAAAGDANPSSATAAASAAHAEIEMVGLDNVGIEGGSGHLGGVELEVLRDMPGLREAAA